MAFIRYEYDSEYGYGCDDVIQYSRHKTNDIIKEHEREITQLFRRCINDAITSGMLYSRLLKSDITYFIRVLENHLKSSIERITGINRIPLYVDVNVDLAHYQHSHSSIHIRMTLGENHGSGELPIRLSMMIDGEMLFHRHNPYVERHDHESLSYRTDQYGNSSVYSDRLHDPNIYTPFIPSGNSFRKIKEETKEIVPSELFSMDD